MKPRRYEDNEMNVGGFQLVPAGTYIWQVDEGIDLITKEDSEVVFLRVPMRVDSVVEGDENAVGLPASYFFTLRDKSGNVVEFAEEQLAAFIDYAGLMDELLEKTKGKEIDTTGEKFLQWAQLKLPGSFIQLTHKIGKDNKGDEQIRFTKIARVTKKGPDATAPLAGDETDEPPW